MTSSWDLDRLTELVTDAVMVQLGNVEPACTCHDLRRGQCPEVMRPLVERGAERFGLNASAPHAGLTGLIDHTLLKPDSTQAQIEKLCREAAEFEFATVCIQPTWVRLAAAALRGTGVGVCTVAGFPLGANTADVKAYETRLDQLVTHPVFDYRCSWRRIIRLQAQLLERHLRGDVPAYMGITTR